MAVTTQAPSCMDLVSHNMREYHWLSSDLAVSQVNGIGCTLVDLCLKPL